MPPLVKGLVLASKDEGQISPVSRKIPHHRSSTIWIACVACVAATAAAFPPVDLLVLAVVLALAVWRWPEWALEIAAFTVLAVRPALDVFSERRFGLSESAINPAVVFGLAILWISVLFSLWRGRLGRPIWPRSTLIPPHLWLLGAYGIAFVSGARLYGVGGAATGARELTRVASIVAAFLVVLWWGEADAKRYRRGWIYLIVGMVVPVVVAAWQLIMGQATTETEGLNRLQGTFSHSNSFGQYLVPFILFAGGGVPTSKGAARIARLAGAVGLCGLVALTYSRTSVLLLVSGFAILPILHARRFGWRGLVRGLGVIALIASLGWWFGGGLIRERFAGLSLGSAAWEMARSGTSENSFTWRLINWRNLVSLGLEHPYTGHGAGMTTVLNPLVSPTNGVPFNAHDDFVRFFFEGGVLGLLCYLIYGALLCGWLLHRARSASPERAAGAYAVAAAWIAMFFLTVGTPELSLQTAIQYQLYGMAALLIVPEPSLTALPVGAYKNASDRLSS